MKRFVYVTAVLLAFGVTYGFLCTHCFIERVQPDERFLVELNSEREIAEFREFIFMFAKKENFEVDDIATRLPPKDGRKVFYLVLKTAGGSDILVSDFLQPRQFLLAITNREGAVFLEKETRLEAMLRNRWPHVGEYLGP